MAAISILQARNSFTNRKRDITDVSSTVFGEWCDFINKYTYRQLQGVDPERFVSSATFTVSAQPQTSALPVDFENIEPLGTGFFLQDDNGQNTSVTLARTGFGSQVMGYYITGSNVVFTGMENQTIVLRYMPTQTAISDPTQYFTLTGLVGGIEIIPGEYLQHLVNALDVLYSTWDADVQEEAYADQRFVRTLNELITSIRKEPAVFGIDDYTVNF